jgi:hypothetical protein
VQIPELATRRFKQIGGKTERQQNEKIKALEERVRTLESLLMSKGINVVELRKGRSDAAA